MRKCLSCFKRVQSKEIFGHSQTRVAKGWGDGWGDGSMATAALGTQGPQERCGTNPSVIQKDVWGWEGSVNLPAVLSTLRCVCVCALHSSLHLWPCEGWNPECPERLVSSLTRDTPIEPLHLSLLFMKVPKCWVCWRHSVTSEFLFEFGLVKFLREPWT